MRKATAHTRIIAAVERDNTKIARIEKAAIFVDDERLRAKFGRRHDAAQKFEARGERVGTRDVECDAGVGGRRCVFRLLVERSCFACLIERTIGANNKRMKFGERNRKENLKYGKFSSFIFFKNLRLLT